MSSVPLLRGRRGGGEASGPGCTTPTTFRFDEDINLSILFRLTDPTPGPGFVLLGKLINSQEIIVRCLPTLDKDLLHWSRPHRSLINTSHSSPSNSIDSAGRGLQCSHSIPVWIGMQFAASIHF